MEYKIHSRDFLKRARKRLDEGTPESLIYAALEIRMGIEARLDRYHDAIDEFYKKVKRGWKISALEKNLDQIFKSGNKIVEIMIIDIKTDKPTHLFYYTPVSKSLIKSGEKIGGLLHHNKLYKSREENWYIETKTYLEKIYLELENANKGTLIGPPIFNPKTRELKLFFDVNESFDPEKVIQEIGEYGKQITIRIHYPEDYPD